MRYQFGLAVCLWICGWCHLSRNLPKTIDLFADIILKPHLPKSDIESVKLLAAQEIMSIEDDPKQKVMLALRKIHFPSPLGNDRRGTLEGLKAITHDALTKFWKKNFRPSGTIISVAGNIEWEPLKAQVEKLFGKWKGGDVPALKLSPGKGGTPEANVVGSGRTTAVEANTIHCKRKFFAIVFACTTQNDFR